MMKDLQVISNQVSRCKSLFLAMILTKRMEPVNVFYWKEKKLRRSGCRKQHCLQKYSDITSLYIVIPCLEITSLSGVNKILCCLCNFQNEVHV